MTSEPLYYVFRAHTDNRVVLITRNEDEADFWRQHLGTEPSYEPWPLPPQQAEPTELADDPNLRQQIKCRAKSPNLTYLGHWQEYRPT